MAGKVDTSWRILATLLTQPRGSEFPEYLTSLAIPGLALFSFAQNGRVRDARETLDRERRLDTGGNGLRRILRLLSSTIPSPRSETRARLGPVSARGTRFGARRVHERAIDTDGDPRRLRGRARWADRHPLRPMIRPRRRPD